MKNLFLVILSLLVIFSQWIALKEASSSGGRGKAPVLYWATDAEPARLRQAVQFKAWLKKKGYPDIDLRVDTANQGNQKQIINGVSGVAGDLLQAIGDDVDFLARIGIYADLTDDLVKLGLKNGDFFPGVYENCQMNGRILGFPLNINMMGLLINRGLFRKLGMSVPAEAMDPATMTALGREFKKRMSLQHPGEARFLVDYVNQDVFTRGFGASPFNETLTRSVIHSEAYIQSLKWIYQWTYEDRIIPSPSERQSFNVEQGLDIPTQLFVREVYGMINSGRAVATTFRKMNVTNMDMAVTGAPHGGYPNVLPRARTTLIYKNSRHYNEALRFIEFLMSPEHNQAVSRDGDAIPGVPSWLDTDDFLKPPQWKNEWEFHAGYSRLAKQNLIGRETSPYIDTTSIRRAMHSAFDSVMSRISSPEVATEIAEKTLNRGIERFVARDPNLEPAYRAALARQDRIDKLKAAGKKIPGDLIDNIFLRRYYRDTGRLE
ncbi:MAG: carbohydrate ABC transporter substrate-binding protein [Spirochaetia bacterium]|nr:carbohydrate ABC transporter substrate-binding protein [Spirochaetia bacterium]